MQDYFKFNSSKIFKPHSPESFEQVCLELFQFQYRNIPVYQDFVRALSIKPEAVLHLKDIPFMPIEFFKDFEIIAPDQNSEIIFKSSGTTGMSKSRHMVQDISVYEASFMNTFELFYGPVTNYVVLALLPSYIENGESSLVYMADQLIQRSHDANSGFYLNDYPSLIKKLHDSKDSSKKILLLGVSYALLDLSEMQKMDFPELIIMETGGMKGRRKEMVREELHHHIKKGFGVENVHSEYGMTELLSQAYSDGNGVFTCPPWMKIMIRDVSDPLSFLEKGKSGAINIIDLANVYSVSFLATKDLGKTTSDTHFEILGRFDNSDVRGCNLLIA